MNHAGLWVIVPVKPLGEAKSRLAGALDPGERATLARDLLRRTLDVVGRVASVAQVVVLTRESKGLDLVAGTGVQVVEEVGNEGLNPALRAATHLASDQGAQAVLVLPADLPRLAPEDVERLAALASPPPVVVVAPDRHHQGTNALLCAPPGLIEYQFGADSLRLHQAQAHSVGARLEVCETPGLALDLDLPEDLTLLRAGRPPSRGPRPRNMV